MSGPCSPLTKNPRLHRACGVVLACVALLTASGCWVPLSQGRAIESDLVELKVELESQRKELEQLESRNERERTLMKQQHDAALARVDESMAALDRAARKTGADIGVELERALAELARLRGLLEELQAKMGMSEESSTQSWTEMDRKLTEALSRISTLEEAAKVKPPERPSNKDDFYKLAKSVLDQGDIAQARALFTEFLSRWENDPLAANAQYWIGETYYSERRYREAITAFVVVTNRYSKSDKVPDALLKIGFAFIELKQTAQGKDFLTEVVKSHPKSAAAKIAKERLAKL